MAGMNVATGGIITGIDTLIDGDTRLGVFAGYSHTGADVSGRDSSTDSDNYHFGVYGGTQWDAVSLRTGVSYTIHELSSRRSVNFAGLSENLRADYDAGTFQAYGELGYKIKTEFGAFEPFVNLAQVSLHTDRFTESGGISALTSSGDTLNTTFSTVGARLSSDFDIGNQKAVATGMVGWRHAFGDTDPTSRFAFAASDSYVVRGAPITTDAMIVQFGVSMNLTTMATIGISYNGDFSSDETVNGVDAKLNVRF
jgi:outer membrane autotransporter protein